MYANVYVNLGKMASEFSWVKWQLVNYGCWRNTKGKWISVKLFCIKSCTISHSLSQLLCSSIKSLLLSVILFSIIFLTINRFYNDVWKINFIHKYFICFTVNWINNFCTFGCNLRSVPFSWYNRFWQLMIFEVMASRIRDFL